MYGIDPTPGIGLKTIRPKRLVTSGTGHPAPLSRSRLLIGRLVTSVARQLKYPEGGSALGGGAHSVA